MTQTREPSRAVTIDRCADEGHALLVIQSRILTERNAELIRLLVAERARATTPRHPGYSTPYCPPSPIGRFQ